MAWCARAVSKVKYCLLYRSAMSCFRAVGQLSLITEVSELLKPVSAIKSESWMQVKKCKVGSRIYCGTIHVVSFNKITVIKVAWQKACSYPLMFLLTLKPHLMFNTGHVITILMSFPIYIQAVIPRPSRPQTRSPWFLCHFVCYRSVRWGFWT